MDSPRTRRKKKAHKDEYRNFSVRMGSNKPKEKTVPYFPDPAPDLRIAESEETSGSKFWASLSFALTSCLPGAWIRRDGSQAKQAWREKVAIFLIMVLTSFVFVGLFGFLPLFLCQTTNHYTWQDINLVNAGVLAPHREAWTIIHGKIYDVKGFMDKHPSGASDVEDYIMKDASELFPRTPPGALPDLGFRECLRANVSLAPNLTEPVCDMLDEYDSGVGKVCHTSATGLDGIERAMGKYIEGTLVYSLSVLEAQGDFQYVVIDNTVYNVTSYLAKNPERNVDAPTAYLDEKLSDIIFLGEGREDGNVTRLFNNQFNDQVVAAKYKKCMDHMFYQGEIDQRYDPVCEGFNVLMFVGLIFVAAILVLQTVCSLFYVFRRSRHLTGDMLKNHVMVLVPCYNEGDKELGKTVQSVLDTDYPEENKIMMIVCDGVITGRGESCSTPETIAKMLGYSMDAATDPAHLYTSIGASTRNRAFVYNGTYKKDGKALKYIVVVKCGADKERNTPRAGNRGKRDSQLIVQGLFNRVQYGRKLNDLDVAICRALNDADVGIEDLRYLMAIDADTRVREDSMAQMIHSMETKTRILACCGETRVDNKSESWVTMIQVYEYFSSHHLKKAFESLFGTVTCLPGCFTMYRILTEDNRPLFACDNVLAQYQRNDIESLHEKNLFHLGEDRMLTTLLLKYFPGMRLSFVPEAICWTIVPHTFKILLSQRRRWINSTFHNMWELLKVKTMCGVCVFSMKTIVIADMISTMILPATLTYAVYFLAVVIVGREPLSQTIVLVYTIIFGSQMIIFILRSRWSYFFWFIAFQILGVPVFYFILPLYSFWHMDDLSWGQTRQVEGGDKSDDTEDGEVEVSGTTETPFCDEDGTLPADLSAPAPPATPQPPGHKGSSATALVHVHTEDGTGRVGTVGLTEV